MKKKINRITKQKWLDVNGVKKVVHKTIKSGTASYYVFDDNMDNIYKTYEVSEFKKLYFLNKYNKFRENNLFLYKSIKVYQKDNEKLYKKVLLDSNTEFAFRIIDSSKESYYDKINKIKDVWKNKKNQFLDVDDGKSKLHFVFKMHDNEFDLMKKRAAFADELNNAFNNVIKSIKFNGLDMEINKGKISELYYCYNSYNLRKDKINKGKIDLVDKKSKNNVYIPDTNNNFKDFLELFSKDKKLDIFVEEVQEYFNKENKKLNKTLNYSRSKKSDIQFIYNEKVFNEILNDYDLNGLYKYINDNLNKKIKKKNNHETKIRETKISSNDVLYFKYIREFYNDNQNIKSLFNNNETYMIKEYLKLIHNYVLGRARKVKYLANDNKNITYNDKLKLFEPDILSKKIINAAQNKANLNSIDLKITNKYGINNNESYKKETLKLFFTFKSKMSSIVYNSVYNGLATFAQQQDIYCAANINGLEQNLKTNGVDYDINYIGAYFLRNYLLHFSDFNKKTEDKQYLSEYLREMKKNFESDFIHKKDNLVEYEVEKIKFNNCFDFIESKKLINICEISASNKCVKSTFLPRFNKIYSKLGKESEISDQENQALKYYYKLYYESTFIEDIENHKNKDLIIKEYKEIISQRFDKIEDKHLVNITEILNIGLDSYRRQHISQCNGDGDEVKKFEKRFINLIKEIFLILIKKNEIYVDSLIKNDNIQDIEAKVREIYEQNINVSNANFDNLFISSIYSCVKLSNLSTKNEINQNITRFITLYKSLEKKYEVLKQNINVYLKEILRVENIEVDDLISDLEDLSNVISQDIKIYNFKNIEIIKDDTTSFGSKVIDDIIVSNLSEIGCENKDNLSSIKYKIKDGRDEVQLYEQGNDNSSGSNVIIPRLFIIEEFNNQSLDYDFKVHQYAFNKSKLNFDDFLEKYSEFMCYPINENLKLIVDYNKPLSSDELNEYAIKDYDTKSFINCCQEIKNNCYKMIRDKKFKKSEYEENFKKVNDLINEYNFISRILTFNQLKHNKRFFNFALTRLMVWCTQSEKFSKLVQNDFDKTFRNHICHLNEFQLGRFNGYTKTKSLLTLFLEVEDKFNKYETKKDKETLPVINKFYSKFNIEVSTKVNNNKNRFVSSQKIIKIGKLRNGENETIELDKISEIEVEYLSNLLSYEGN